MKCWTIHDCWVLRMPDQKPYMQFLLSAYKCHIFTGLPPPREAMMNINPIEDKFQIWHIV